STPSLQPLAVGSMSPAEKHERGRATLPHRFDGFIPKSKAAKAYPPNQVKPIIEALEDRSLLSIQPLYYSIDGAGNNLANPTWGSAGTDLIRLAGTAYADGISVPRGEGVQAGTLPGARLISNLLAVQTGAVFNNRNLAPM